MEQIEKRLSLYVSMHWEHLCREAVSGNKVSGVRWKEASRWWGAVSCGNSNIPMELDVLAESEDGTKLLVGECKWTNSENAKISSQLSVFRRNMCCVDNHISSLSGTKS